MWIQRGMGVRMLRRVSVLALFNLIILAGCNLSNDNEMTTWSATDHDHQLPLKAANSSQTGANRPGDQKEASRGMPSLSRYGVSDVVVGTWKNQCVRCHGVIGRGDGPQGSLVGAKDLTDPTWQNAVSDAQIKHSILNGKGRMPAFAQIPAGTLEGLLKLVRLLNRKPVDKVTQ